MKILEAADFDGCRENSKTAVSDREELEKRVGEIISAIREEGDAALRRFTRLYDRGVPEHFEISPVLMKEAWEELKREDVKLAGALELAADHIRRFAEMQKAQLRDFEAEIAEGLFVGQRVIPLERAAVYVPAGRYPLVSTVLMGAIPALCAGVAEVVLASPPAEGGLPDRRILAAAALAGVHRIFAAGGAQAVAALALGTESIPRADIICGPGNRYVAAAKRLLYGEVGIDFTAGPTDVLIISDGSAPGAGALAAADMLAQAEHDPDARARALVPNRALAEDIVRALNAQLEELSTAETAGASLEAGGLIIVYNTREEAQRIANEIAPEHLELLVAEPSSWIGPLKNYGSLFAGPRAAEALGDYSAGINHTLPTSGSARFTGGLSVRSFLKTPTSLRCVPGPGLQAALEAAEQLARAEGLEGHGKSAARRRLF
jgi:histidinol dehydrogenase